MPEPGHTAAQNFAIHSELPDAMREFYQLMDLLYDATMSLDVSPDGVRAFYQFTLL